MRLPPVALNALLTLVIGSSASAVTMDWTQVGNPGNACDPQPGTAPIPGGCFGAVSYGYSIGTYEVTNAQYAEFLNAKAIAADPFGLYSEKMGNPTPTFDGFGGISRTESAGSYTYSAIAGRENMPVNYVSFWDALRFANWMNNGQGTGDTEAGAYTLLGGTSAPSNGATVIRNAGATIFLTSEDEWYKAAYYDAALASFFNHPAGFDLQTVCGTPTATPNTANCSDAVVDVTPVGSYTGSPSPYGTFDQGGNVLEWNEAIVFSDAATRGKRGGFFGGHPLALSAAIRSHGIPTSEEYFAGFRLVMIPEPSTGLLVIAGLLGFACRQRRQ